tara:strand:- start:550 stop:1539 length:990 start_codon:yes stop_codon:yes gene_type:complete
MFEGKQILITGGTGSLGHALTEKLLELGVEKIRIYSRNEHKQIEMESHFNDKRLRFLLGDVRDYNRLIRAIEGVDIVYHAAALKHVPKIEYNPFEAVKTNVYGTQNVIDACMYNNVERAICVGTDKAVSPLNTYGATKLLMEKLFITAIQYSNPKKHLTKFFAVRYGNVFGSSGSVIPKFIQQIKSNKKITITDPNMTRFTISMDNALELILNATKSGQSSEVFVPKLKAYSLQDIADVIKELLGDMGQDIIGIRPGEKLHEVLINNDEIRNSWEYNNMYMIKESPIVEKSYPGIKKIKDLKMYSSNTVEKISKSELIEIIKKSGLLDV